MLTNEEKLSIVEQHLKNLELNAYNLSLSLVTENSVTEPNELTIKLLEEQLSDLNTKIESINVEKNKFDKGSIKTIAKFSVVDYESRNWNSDDAKFWTKFGISSKSLERYNVMPLKSFDMKRDQEQIKISKTTNF